MSILAIHCCISLTLNMNQTKKRGEQIYFTHILEDLGINNRLTLFS